jgi:hypothetical protein
MKGMGQGEDAGLVERLGLGGRAPEYENENPTLNVDQSIFSQNSTRFFHFLECSCWIFLGEFKPDFAQRQNQQKKV